MTRRMPCAVAGEMDSGDLRRVGVAEVHQGAEDDDGDQDADVAEDVARQVAIGDLGGQGEHDDQCSRAGGDGKGEGIERLLFEGALAHLGVEFGVFLLVARGLAGVLLVEHGPADGGDDDAARELHDGQRDAEEAQDGRAQQLDDGEEDDVVDGDAAGERAIDLGACVADQAEKDQRGSERIDQRQQSGEGDEKRIPNQQGRYLLRCTLAYLRGRI